MRLWEGDMSHGPGCTSSAVNQNDPKEDKTIMKIKKYTPWMILLGVSLSCACMAEISSSKDLGVVLEQAIQCKVEAVDALDPRGKPDLQKHLSQLGVKVHGVDANYDPDADASWELEYTLPTGVGVFGHEIKTTHYDGYSASFFYTEFPGGQAELDKLKDLLHLGPVTSASIPNYIEYATYKPVYEKRIPWRDSKATLVAGLERMDGQAYVVVGCVTPSS
jgi:hypothetical protein